MQLVAVKFDVFAICRFSFFVFVPFISFLSFSPFSFPPSVEGGGGYYIFSILAQVALMQLVAAKWQLATTLMVTIFVVILHFFPPSKKSFSENLLEHPITYEGVPFQIPMAILEPLWRKFCFW